MGAAKLACLAFGRHGEQVAGVHLWQLLGPDSLLVAKFALPSPMESQKWAYRHTSQHECPWNIRFARENRIAEFAPREASKGPPMKRAKLQGLKRNPTAVLDNLGVPEAR